jgi:multiple sugar transport system ATP-binding protein
VAEIEFSSVGKRYPDGTEAVRDLDLKIEDREFMILVGPSGCGKTTTLRMLAGLEAITSGELRIGGKVVNDLPPGKRDIAMVFQSYALYPHMSVARNMGFALRKAGVPKEEIRRRVEEVAELLGIAEHLDRKPAQLSGGQRQRVAMGRALVREPSTFLLDEPLSNLDAKLRIQMRAEILRIHRRAETTTVYVTHDQGEAMTLGDRVAVMRDGQIRQLATPEELYDRPRDLFVASFIGAPQMNLLPARVEDGALKLPITSVPLDEAGLRGRLNGHLDGRPLVAGIRPEDFEDASIVGPGRGGHTITAVVDVLEGTGSDLYAHIALDPEHGKAQEAPGAKDARDDDVPLPAELVARVNTHSRIREGDAGEIWVDTSRMHLFDATTGERLSDT